MARLEQTRGTQSTHHWETLARKKGSAWGFGGAHSHCALGPRQPQSTGGGDRHCALCSSQRLRPSLWRPLSRQKRDGNRVRSTMHVCTTFFLELSSRFPPPSCAPTHFSLPPCWVSSGYLFRCCGPARHAAPGSTWIQRSGASASASGANRHSAPCKWPLPRVTKCNVFRAYAPR